MLQKITWVSWGNVDGRCCYWINGCDGLSVPTDWVQEVIKVLGKCFKDTLNMNKDSKLFVLDTQRTGKSTLSNSMFDVQVSVKVGPCVKGIFMK